jgi:hypothetical protein
MSQSVILVFVNLGREHAFVSVSDDQGVPQLAAALGVGDSARQFAAVGSTWSVVAKETYQITAGDKNRVYLIGSGGLYEVENVRGLAAESGASSTDFDLPAMGGGGFP